MAPRGAAPARVASLASAARVPPRSARAPSVFSDAKRRRARGRQRGTPGPVPSLPRNLQRACPSPPPPCASPLFPPPRGAPFDSRSSRVPSIARLTPLSAASLPLGLRPCARPPRRAAQDPTTTVLGFSAGALIGIGALLMSCVGGASRRRGSQQLVQFPQRHRLPAGLTLVAPGAELFTGNVMTMLWSSRSASRPGR